MPYEILRKFAPDIYHDVKSYWTSSYDTYAAAQYQRMPIISSEGANRCRALFLSALEDSHGAQTAAEFNEYPIIQSGCHCHLFMACNTTFSALVQSWLGATAAGLKNFLVYSCTTVSLETSGKKGPAWLQAERGPTKILKIPRKRLSSQSVCSTSDVSIDRDAIASVEGWLDEYEQVAIKSLMPYVPEKPMDDLSTGFSNLNRSHVKCWSQPNDTQPLFIDDWWVAGLISRHLHEETIISRLIIDTKTRNSCYSELRRVKEQTDIGRFLPVGTTLFWFVRDGKVRPAHVQDDVAYEIGNQNNSIELKKHVIITAIEERKILPDLFLLFLALSILPRIKVLGGLRQIVYYKIFHDVAVNKLLRLDPRSRDFRHDVSKKALHAWGMRVFEPQSSVLSLLGKQKQGFELAGIRQDVADVTLKHTTRNLALFDLHPLWRTGN